jgi:hypothetical protein
MYWLYFTTEPVIHTRSYRGPGFPGSKGSIRDNAIRCRLDGRFFNSGRALPALLARSAHPDMACGLPGGWGDFRCSYSSSPQAEADLRVIISGLFVLFQVKRYEKSVNNFELIAIYLILLQFYPQGIGVVTGPIAVEPGLCRWCIGSVPLSARWLADRAVP